MLRFVQAVSREAIEEDIRVERVWRGAREGLLGMVILRCFA